MKTETNLKIEKCNELAEKIKQKFNLKNTLYLNCSMVRIFSSFHHKSNLEIQSYGSISNPQNLNNEQVLETNKMRSEGKNIDLIKIAQIKNHDSVMLGDPINELDKIKDTFDFIAGDLPFGLMPKEYTDKNLGFSIKERKNWLIMLKSLFSLKEDGQGLFVVEPAILYKKDFVKKLNDFGFFINAVFACPEKTFSPYTNIDAYLLLITKQKSKKIFTIELNEKSNIGEVLEAYINKSQGSDFSTGLWLDLDNFRGFKESKTSNRVTKLLEQYKTFKLHSLKEISKSIEIGDKIKPISNSIYIPRNGRIVQIDYEKIKSNNYYQLEIDSSLALAEYLVLFFNTDVGRSILELIESGNYIPNKRRQDLENLEIPLPELEIQKEIVSLNKKLLELNSKISNFENEIALSPLSCQKIKNEVDKMLDSLNLLNDSDKVLSFIREGENKTLEFKETLTKNIRTNQKDKEMEKMVLKTIVAFFNTEGGTLLIGVSDSGEIRGIEQDFYETNDNYLKHLHNLIRDQIGEQFFPLIDYKIIEVNNSKIVEVNCKRSRNPVYLGKNEEFYIRSNPATDKLTGKKLVEYIKNHFNGDSA